jgi:hypothetical protein
MTQTENWIACTDYQVGDILRWKEPIWAVPNKPRGKPDQIGEQSISAAVIMTDEVVELTVRSIEKISSGDAPLKVKAGDIIRRKPTSIAKGDCHKLITE